MRFAEADAGNELLKRNRPWFLLRFESGISPDRFFTARIAWPAYAWRVIVPAPFDDETDPLQRAIMKLAAAGKTDPYELGRLLGIDQALAKRVLEEGRSVGIFDERFGLTSHGQERLRSLKTYETPMSSAAAPSERYENVRPGAGLFSGQMTSNKGPLRCGWIFRDAVSGDVIPVFFEGSLPEAPFVAREEVTPLPYDGGTRKMPSISNITYALQFYRRIMMRFSPADMDQWWLLADQSDPEDLHVTAWQDVDDIKEQKAGNKALEPPELISIVSPEPEAVDIETYLYVIPDDLSNWYVRSPWKPFAGGWFKQKLEWAIGHSKDLKDQVAKWLAMARERFSASGLHLDEYEVRVAEDFPGIRARAELKKVYDTLILAYRAERLFEEDTANLDMVLIRYCRSLELLLRACISGLQDREEAIQKLGKYDFGYRIQDIAKYFSVKLPRSMADDEMGRRIRFVARYGGGSLRDQAIYLLVHAYYTENSPFRAVLRDRPDVLELIDRVAYLRNIRGGHYDPDVEIMNETELVEKVGSAAKTVLEVVSSHFFGR